MGLLKLLETAHEWADRKLEGVNTYFYARAEKEKEIKRAVSLRDYAEATLNYLMHSLKESERIELKEAVLHPSNRALNLTDSRIAEFYALHQDRITKLASAWNIENTALENTSHYIELAKKNEVPLEQNILVQKEPEYNFLTNLFVNTFDNVYGKVAAVLVGVLVGTATLALVSYKSPASAAPVRDRPGVTTINPHPEIENPIETQTWAPKPYPRTGEQRQAIDVSEKASTQYVEEVGGDVNAKYPETQPQQSIDSVVNNADPAGDAAKIDQSKNEAYDAAGKEAAGENAGSDGASVSKLELRVRAGGGHCTSGQSVLPGGNYAQPFEKPFLHEVKSDGTIVNTYGPFGRLDKNGAQIYVQEIYLDGDSRWFNQNVNDVSDAGSTNIKYRYAAAKADGRVAMIIDAYKNSSMTVREINETFGISKSSFYTLLKKEGETTRTAAAKRNALEQKVTA